MNHHPNRQHLDVDQAILVFNRAHHEQNSEADNSDLDFGQYITYDLPALLWLAEHVTTVSSLKIGFERLCSQAAVMISRIKCDFVELSNLLELDPEAASRLYRESHYRPIIDLRMNTPIGPAAISNLLAGAGALSHPLSLSLPSLSEAEARVLRTHAHELYLHIGSGQFSQPVAQILSSHAGYHLMLELTDRMSPDLWHCLSSSGKLLQRFNRPDGSCYYLLEDLGYVSKAYDASGRSLHFLTP